MSFEQPKFDNQPLVEKENSLAEQKEAKKGGLEGLRSEINEMSLILQKEGVPIDNQARLDINKYKDVYSERSIESDNNWVKDLKSVWERAAKSSSRWSWVPNKEGGPKDIPIGDVFEMLATAIFSEFLGENFITLRTTEYDDIRNKVDNLIVERKTGNVVCAFDEVGDSNGKRFEEKRSKVLERNWQRGGADLKYGLSYEQQDGQTKLKKGAIYQIPLFYLSLSEEEIKKALYDPGQRGKIFQKFISSAKEQIEEIKGGPVHSKLKERLDFFTQVIEKF
jgi:hypothetical protein